VKCGACLERIGYVSNQHPHCWTAEVKYTDRESDFFLVENAPDFRPNNFYDRYLAGVKEAHIERIGNGPWCRIVQM
jgi:hypothetical protein